MTDVAGELDWDWDVEDRKVPIALDVELSELDCNETWLLAEQELMGTVIVVT